MTLKVAGIPIADYIAIRDIEDELLSIGIVPCIVIAGLSVYKALCNFCKEFLPTLYKADKQVHIEEVKAIYIRATRIL